MNCHFFNAEHPVNVNCLIMANFLRISTSLRDMHFLNAASPSEVNESDNEIFLSEVHLLKALVPIDVTVYGISIEGSEVHSRGSSAKVEAIIVVTHFGMVKSFNEVQELNAQSPIKVTESGIFMCYNAEEGIVTVFNPEHFEKAPSPIIVTEEGSTISVKE